MQKINVHVITVKNKERQIMEIAIFGSQWLYFFQIVIAWLRSYAIDNNDHNIRYFYIIQRRFEEALRPHSFNIDLYLYGFFLLVKNSSLSPFSVFISMYWQKHIILFFSLCREQIKVASPSTKLEYFDGVLNLTYTDGEAYRDPNHTLRQAEIAFLCDMTAKEGSPKFLEEKEFTYAFEWRTQYACPTLPIECAITDEETHKQYDLSRLEFSSFHSLFF